MEVQEEQVAHPWEVQEELEAQRKEVEEVHLMEEEEGHQQEEQEALSLVLGVDLGQNLYDDVLVVVVEEEHPCFVDLPCSVLE